MRGDCQICVSRRILHPLEQSKWRQMTFSSSSLSQIGAYVSFLGGIAPPSSSIPPSHLILTKQIAILGVHISLLSSNEHAKTLSPPT